jgi:hypothetical protein
MIARGNPFGTKFGFSIGLLENRPGTTLYVAVLEDYPEANIRPADNCLFPQFY